MLDLQDKWLTSKLQCSCMATLSCHIQETGLLTCNQTFRKTDGLWDLCTTVMLHGWKSIMSCLSNKTTDPSWISDAQDHWAYRVAGGLLDISEPAGLVDHRMTDGTLDFQMGLSWLVQRFPGNEDLKMFMCCADKQVLCCCCPWFCILVLSLFNKIMLTCSCPVTLTFVSNVWVYFLFMLHWSNCGFRFHVCNKLCWGKEVLDFTGWQLQFRA